MKDKTAKQDEEEVIFIPFKKKEVEAYLRVDSNIYSVGKITMGKDAFELIPKKNRDRKYLIQGRIAGIVIEPFSSTTDVTLRLKQKRFFLGKPKMMAKVKVANKRMKLRVKIKPEEGQSSEKES